MKIAMSNIAWYPEDRIAAYEILQSFDVTGIEIAPGLLFWQADDPFVPDLNTATHALAELRKKGLSLVSMQSLLFGQKNAQLFGSKRERQAFFEGIERAISLAGRFGIPNLVMGSPKQRIVPGAMPTYEARNIAKDVFCRLADQAQKAGTRIAIEPNPIQYGTNFLTNMTDASAFVRYVNHPAVTLNFDIGAVLMTVGEDRLSELIVSTIDFVSHIHMSAPYLAPAPALETTAELLSKTLDHLEYSGWVSIEMARGENGLQDVSAALTRFSSGVHRALTNRRPA